METQEVANGFAAPKPSREDVREKRADVRFRIALKALDSGNSDWLEDHVHELTEEQREQLAGKAIELRVAAGLRDESARVAIPPEIEGYRLSG